MSEERSLKSLLRTRFHGTLLGGAIGDALGFPFEGSSRPFMMALGSDVMDSFEKHRSGYFPAGQFSDDTQMTLATIESILECRSVDGANLARHFVPLWRENTIIGRDETSSAAIHRLIDGVATWQASGEEVGVDSNAAATRAAPLGLWNYDRPDQLLEDVETASRITHQDPQATAAAAAVAAAVAYNVTHREVILGEFLDSVCEATAHFDEELARHIADLPRSLAMREAETLEQLSRAGAEHEPRGPQEGVPPLAMPTVLVALFYFLRSPNDYSRTVRNALFSGGDVDTVASIAGALSGALLGAEALPKHLVDCVLHHDQIISLGDRFYGLKGELRTLRR